MFEYGFGIDVSDRPGVVSGAPNETTSYITHLESVAAEPNREEEMHPMNSSLNARFMQAMDHPRLKTTGRLRRKKNQKNIASTAPRFLPWPRVRASGESRDSRLLDCPFL